MGADEEEEAARSMASLNAGGLPVKAQRRLDDARKNQGRFFTSTLSVPEGLIARADAGIRPFRR